MAYDHDHWGHELILDCDYVDRLGIVDGDKDKQEKQDIVFIAGDLGRDYRCLIAASRLPYSWGDVRYGKCGIDTNNKNLKKSKILYDRKNKKIMSPYKLETFVNMR